MGYIVRKSLTKRGATLRDKAVSDGSQLDLLADLDPPIDRNIRVDFENNQQRNDFDRDLTPVIEAAKVARNAINKALPESPALALTRPSRQDLQH
jgi:hypothetical protein